MVAVRFAAAALLLILLLLAWLHPAGAQVTGGATRLEISSVDTAEFPTVALNLIVTDHESRRVTDLSALVLRENGRPVSDWSVEEVPAGTDVIFVLDANASITTVDDDTGRTRLEKVQDSLIRYATQYMSREEQDHVSLIVPEGEGGRFLVQDATRPAQLRDALSGYAPESFGPTPLQAMLELALTQAETTAGAGRFQAIVLFTDGAELAGQLDFAALVSRAQETSVTFFAVILGARADINEIENVARLYEPTAGYYLHLPNAPDADLLFGQLQDNGTQSRVTFLSSHEGSGEYRLQVNLGELQAQSTLALQLEPPLLTIESPDTIRRAGTQPDTPLPNLQPAVQPLSVQLDWPGNQPVALEEVMLLVDGRREAPLETPVVDGNGVLQLEWDIATLDAGTYALAVEVTDALGRTTTSDPVAVTIEVVRPEPPTPTPAPPTPTPEPPLPAALSAFREDSTPLLLAGLTGLFLLVAGVLIQVRRRRAAGAALTGSPDDEQAQAWLDQLAARQGGTPEELAGGVGEAYLTVLQFGPEHSGPIPLEGDDITIGRDPRLVQIPLADQSVSLLHARIRRRKGEFWLYDEGSAGGTFLNFERIGLAPHLLQEGDQIHLGRVHLRFHESRPG